MSGFEIASSQGNAPRNDGNTQAPELSRLYGVRIGRKWRSVARPSSGTRPSRTT